MPATKFYCPDRREVEISDCLRKCPFTMRCMAKPTLKTLAAFCADRGLTKFSVTELLRGARETFLLETKDYAVDPQNMLFAAHGTALHKVNEDSVTDSDGIITELRLENDIATGQIDAYGDVFGTGQMVICDYKVTSSYKAMRALGYYTASKETGEVYKTGAKKGQPKTKKVWYHDGVKDVWEWALQQNFYRMLLEEQGYRVDAMYIQMYVRDYSLQIASTRNIIRPIYVLELNRISNDWLKLWFKLRKERLETAFMTNTLPPPCTAKENWHGLKCQKYCAVADYCEVEKVTLPKAV